MTPPRESEVYFLKCGSFVRIAVSVRGMPPPSDMPAVCARYNPYPVLLLGARPGDDADVALLRARHREHLLRGFWYRLEGDLLRLPEFRSRPELRRASYPGGDDWEIVDDPDLADAMNEPRARVVARSLDAVEDWCRVFDVSAVGGGYAVAAFLGDELLGYLRLAGEAPP